jgi:hypothetical protein
VWLSYPNRPVSRKWQALLFAASLSRVAMGRMIDPYIFPDKDEPGKWWCFYKQNGVSMSWSRDLKTWTYVGKRRAGENVATRPVFQPLHPDLPGHRLLAHRPNESRPHRGA